MTLEVTLLQFFYAYVQATPAGLMNDAWSSLQALIKDCFQISNFPPQALFMLMGLVKSAFHLDEFINVFSTTVLQQDI